MQSTRAEIVIAVLENVSLITKCHSNWATEIKHDINILYNVGTITVFDEGLAPLCTGTWADTTMANYFPAHTRDW